jgi:hypothetical protein
MNAMTFPDNNIHGFPLEDEEVNEWDEDMEQMDNDYN